MCGDFLKKRAAQRLGVYRCLKKKKRKKRVSKVLYKTKHKTTQQNRKLANLHRQNDLFKATMFQRHKDYYGFVKTGFENKPHYGHTNT